MPELPEVETIACDLRKYILHKTIQDIHIHDPYVIKQPPQDFSKRLKGKRIEAINRLGKALIFELSSHDHWVVQLMMTGQLVYNAKEPVHARASVKFSDGNWLSYNDQRRFGHLRIVKSIDEIKYFRILGPEPLADRLDPDAFYTKIHASGRSIKNVLMDHTVIAGIGNIYASEILFYAAINPKRLGSKLTKKEVAEILTQIPIVLKAAIKARGCSMRNYRDADGNEGGFNKFLKVYNKAGEKCPRCSGTIEQITQNGRSTFFCPRCQK